MSCCGVLVFAECVLCWSCCVAVFGAVDAGGCVGSAGGLRVALLLFD